MRLPSLFSSKRRVKLGFDLEAGEPISMSLDRLATHLHVLGPPGSGKTRLLFSIFQQLCEVPGSSVVLFNLKGDLGINARDWCIAHGYTKRLIWFDPAEDQSILGYNPLQPNGLSVASHAKNVREAIRSAWGQTSFDQTAQLARALFLTLFVVRELSLTLTEALALLRPGSNARRAIIPAISDPYIREELEYIDALQPNRQDELLSPTLARLQSFVLDPTIRRIITQQMHSMTLTDVLRENRVLIVNFEQYKPLSLDDIKLLSRFIINDLVAHIFNRPEGQRAPVYLLLDEAQNFCTADLCRALAQGRELGMHCLLAHHYLNQFREEERTGMLADSVLKCARTKILFGGLSNEDLEVLVPEVAIDQYNPWRIKDELTSLELDPIESSRTVYTEGGSVTETETDNEEFSDGTSWSSTDGEEESFGESDGDSTEQGNTIGGAVTDAVTDGTTRTSATVSANGRVKSSSFASGVTSFESTGETLIPDSINSLGLETPEVIATTAQKGEAKSSATADSLAESESESSIETEREVHTRSRAQSKNWALQESRGKNHSQSHNHGSSWSETEAEQETHSLGHSSATSRGKNWSRTNTPFHEYKKRRVVSSRQFLNKDEQMTLVLQQIKTQPTAHFALKVPDQRLTFVRALFVKDVWISNRMKNRAFERIYQQPCYGNMEAIASEEQERAKRIRELGSNKEAETGSKPSADSIKRATKKRLTPKASKKRTTTTPFDCINLEEDDPFGRE